MRIITISIIKKGNNKKDGARLHQVISFHTMSSRNLTDQIKLGQSR